MYMAIFTPLTGLKIRYIYKEYFQVCFSKQVFEKYRVSGMNYHRGQGKVIVCIALGRKGNKLHIICALKDNVVKRIFKTSF